MKTNDYWIWLTSIDLFNHKNINTLMKYFASPEEVWRASPALLMSIENLSPKYIQKILDSKDQKKLESKLLLLEERKVKYISIDNKEYPEELKNIYDYPYGFYMKGHLSKTKTKIAIVGSRKCSSYGISTTLELSKQLAQNDISIVSGMAKGIDTFAHIGALEIDKEDSTIAVLGCGIDICYPKENYDLMNKIIEKGAVISEYPLSTQPHAAFFPQRNRIISGLSKAVIVVEAAQKSGSLITCDLALEQGRDIFAIPGNITSALSKGTNNLIKQGASIITSFDDVLEELGLTKKIYLNTKLEKINNQDFLAPDEKLVYDCISLEPQDIDVIFDKLDISINKLQYLLTMLELKGYIEQNLAHQYTRIL